MEFSAIPGLLVGAVGIELLSLIESTQLTDFPVRQKRQNGQISGIEVHGRYTGGS